MGEFAVTVVGADRPGIIAEVTGALAGLGANLADSSMTLLRGHFAMTLICTGDVGVDTVRRSLAPVTADGSLACTVDEVTERPDGADGGRPWVVSVHGADQIGLVAAVTRILAGVGGNVTDATSRLAGELYVLVVEVRLPAGTDTDRLFASLSELDLDLSLRPADEDVL